MIQSRCRDNPLNRAVPADAFIAPDESNKRDIELLFADAWRRVLNHLSKASQRPPMPSEPSAVQMDVMNRDPVPNNVLLDQLESILLNSMNQANPNYIGHMDPMPTTFSIIGDMAAAGLNNNMLSVEMSPALTSLENDLMKSMACYFGLEENSGGVLLNGGTLGNLQALAVARNAALDCHKKGVAVGTKSVILTSVDAHVSIQKVAMLLGLGTDSVVSLPVDGHGRMRPEALKLEVNKAQRCGIKVMAIVATAGTTIVGSIDPLVAIAKIAREHDIWFHVDAAYGGALQFSSCYRTRLVGIEFADSIVFNPQKWLFVSRTCVALMFRNLSVLEDHFQIRAPYMLPSTVPNLGELTVQGTRSTDVLKLWLSLSHLGTKGCGTLVEQGCKLASHADNCVRRRPYLQSACTPDTNLLCFSRRLHDGDSDIWNQQLQQYLSEQGFFLSLPTYRGIRWLRMVLLNPYTTQSTVDRLFDAIDIFSGFSTRTSR